MPACHSKTFNKAAFVHLCIMHNHESSNVKRIIKRTGSQFIALFMIIAIGFAIIYFSDNIAMAICWGILYLIEITGVILVIIADDYDRRLKAYLKSER